MKLSHHKRVISLFLAFLMVFSLTTPLFAVETPEIPTAMPEESVTNESDQVQNNQEPEGSQETLPTQSGTTEEADESNQQTNPEGEVADTFSLKIFGRGVTSSNTEEQIKAGTEVVLTINVPEQQRLFSFDVNDEEKKDALVLQEDGSLTYTFTMEKDTVVKVYYETLPTVPVGDKKVHFSFEFIDPLNKRLVGVPTDWSINQEFIPRFNQSFILRDEYGNEYKPDETEEPAETTAMTFSNLATGEYYLEYTPPYDEAFFTPYRYLWNGRVYRVHRLTSIYVDKDENSLVLRMKANIPLVSEEKEIYVPTPNPNASSNTNINRIVEALPKTWTLRDPLFPEREYQARVNWRFSTFDLRKLSLNKEVMIRGRIFEDSSDPWERFYTSDRTIYVVVKTEDILPVKVTFDHNYEGAPEAIVLQPNGEGIVTPPADPVREGYTFLGWFFDQGGYGEPIDFSYALFTEDTTVYAKWEEIPPVEVTFNQNYEGAPEATTVEADKEGKVTPPEAPVREGYSFKGWFVNAEGTGEAVDFETATFTENTILYAKWEELPPVEVTFNQNYEGAPEATTVEADKEGKVTPPEAPVREGYSFKGWFRDAEGTGEAVDFETATFTENTTLYAKWTKINYENVQVRFYKDSVVSRSYWVSKDLAQEFMPKFFIVNTETGVKYTPTEGSYNQRTGMALIENVPEGNYTIEFAPGEPFHVEDFYLYDSKASNYKPIGLNGSFEVVKGKNPHIASMVISSIKLVKILPQDPEEYEVEVANDNDEANALIQKLKNEVLPKTVKIELSNGETVEANLVGSGFDIRPNQLMKLDKQAVYSWFVLPDRVSKNTLDQRLETKVVLHVVPKKPPVGHLEPAYFTMWHGSSLNLLTPEDFAPGDFYLESVETGIQYNWKEGELVPHYENTFNTKKILKLEVPVGEYKVVFVPRADRVLVGAFEDQNNYKPFDIEKQNFTVHYNPAPTLKKNYLDFVNRAKDSYTLTLEGENISSVPAAGKIPEQTEVKVTVAPEAGYKVSSFTVNNEDKLAELVDNVYTFTINKDTTVKVEYEKIPEMWHKVSFVAGEHGTLEGTVEFTDILNGTPWKDAGITVPTPKADEGYKFKGWSPELPGDDSVIDKDIAYTAIFEEVLKKDVSLEFYKDKPNTHPSHDFSKENNKRFAELFVLVNTETKEEYKADVDSFIEKERGLIRGVPEGTYEIKFTAPNPFNLVTYAVIEGSEQPKVFEGSTFVVTRENDHGIGVVLRSSIQVEEIVTPNPEKYLVVKTVNTTEANVRIGELKDNILPKTVKVVATNGNTYECELAGNGFDIRPIHLEKVGIRTVYSMFKLPEELSEPEDGIKLETSVKLDVREKPATITFDENYDGAPTAKDVVTDNFFRLIAPTDPIREGYIFKGWFHDAEGTGEAVDFETATFTENTTLYAKWERKPTATLNFSFSFIHNDNNSRAVGIPEHWSANPNFVSDFNKSFKLKDAQGNLHEPTSISEDKTSLVFEGLAPGKYTTVYTAPYGNTRFKPYVWMLNGRSLGAYNASKDFYLSKTDTPNTLELELTGLVPLLPKEDETVYEIPAYDPALSDDENVAKIREALPKEWTVYDKEFPEKTFEGTSAFYFYSELKELTPGTEHVLEGKIFEVRTKPWDRVYNHHGVDHKISVKVKTPPVEVTFDQNYEGAPEATTVEADKEGKVTPPANPTREKYDFKGWYADKEGSGEKINFSTATFTENTTVYAKWELKPTATLNFSFSFIHNDNNSRAVGIPEHWSANPNFVSDFNKSFKLKDAQGNLHEPTSISEDKTSLVFEGLTPGKYTTVYTAPYGNTRFKPYVWMFNGRSLGAYNASKDFYLSKTDAPNTLELELKGLVPLLPKEDETIYEIPAYDPTLSDAVNTENVKAALPKERTVYDEQFPEKTFIGYTGYYFSRQLKDFKPGTEHDINASVYEYRENPWDRAYNHHGVDFKIKVKVPELPAKVIFDQNYEGAPEATTVEADKEGKVTPPANPTREKYDFKGWYADKEGSGEKINFSTATFTENTTVYAKWELSPTATLVFEFSFIHNNSNGRAVGLPEHWSANPNFVSDFNKSFKVKDEQGTVYEPTSISEDKTSLVFEGLTPGKYTTVYTAPYGDDAFKPYVWMLNGRSQGAYKATQTIGLWNASSYTLQLELKGLVPLVAKEDTTVYEIPAYDPALSNDENVAKIREALPTEWTVYDKQFSEKSFEGKSVFYFYNELKELTPGAERVLGGKIYEVSSKPWDRVYNHHAVEHKIRVKVKTPPVEVIFDQNYEGAPEATTVEADKEGRVTPPANPTREKYDFKGWYADKEGSGEAIDFTTATFTENTTVYAKWEEKDPVDQMFDDLGIDDDWFERMRRFFN